MCNRRLNAYLSLTKLDLQLCFEYAYGYGTKKLGKLDKPSKDTLSKATDIFATGDSYTALMGGDFEELAPIRASETGSQEFIIRPSLAHYIDSLNTYMIVKVKVVKADVSAIAAANDLTIIPEDSFCANLFDAVEVSVHGQVIQYEPY